MSQTSPLKAEQPTTIDNLQYHTRTGKGDIAPLCLIVGAPGRADMIAEKFFSDPKRFANDHRGIVTQTGYYKGVHASVTTSGMGGASLGIVVPEAVLSGARLFIRVGSCGSLIKDSKIGESIIVEKALRHDGASLNWAPKHWPALADERVVWALIEAAKEIAPEAYHVGTECTTDCFREGQGRLNINGKIPLAMKRRHSRMMKGGAECYSMEAASLFTWCSYVANAMPSGAINAIFGNRHTNEWDTAGEEQAAKIALEALVLLSKDPQTLARMADNDVFSTVQN